MNKPIHILITNFHHGYGGGHETFTMNIIEHIHPFFRIIVACPASSRLYQRAQEAGITVYDVDFKSRALELSKKIRAIRQMRSIIRTEQIDIIHLQGSSDHRITISALIGIHPKPKIIFTRHNTLPIRFFGKLRLKYTVDCIIGVSKFNIVELEKIGFSSEKLKLANNGISLSKFTSTSEKIKHAQRKALGIPEDAFVFGSVAGTLMMKGWRYIVEATSKIPDPRIRIVIAGAPISTHEFDMYIRAFNMQDRVIFPGLLKEVVSCIHTFDVGFVLSDRSENMSYACREMMACGIPIIISDIGGLPENISEGLNGWIVPHGQVAPLIPCIQEILERSPESLHSMGLQARNTIQTQFSMEKFIDQIEQIYQDLLKTASNESIQKQSDR